MTDQPTSLREQYARAIRDAVRVRLGPNSLRLAEEGRPVMLNYSEAEAAADAVLALQAAAGQASTQQPPMDPAAILGIAPDYAEPAACLQASTQKPDAAVVDEFVRHMATEHPAAAHCCSNCHGIDPATCLMNPSRTAGQRACCGKPSGAVCVHDVTPAVESPAASPSCEVGIVHTEHCPTPETHNWGCGCPTDELPGHGLAEAVTILHDAMQQGVQDPVTRQTLIGQLVGACRHVEELRPAADRHAILAEAASDLCAFGHGEAAAFLLDKIESQVVVEVHTCPDGEPCPDHDQPAIVVGQAAAPPETDEAHLQVWPLKRVLAEVRCGSDDWPWESEWANLDQRHATTGYLDKLEQKIRQDGITMPILIGSDGRLWDGHHRLRIAVRLGIEYIPVELVQPWFTEASAAFRQIGVTPSLESLRAELRIEGFPPLIGNYAGAGMRRIEEGVLAIEPMLLFAWADTAGAETTIEEDKTAPWDGTASGATHIIDWVHRNGGTATYTCTNTDRCATHDGDCSHYIRLRTPDSADSIDVGDRVVRTPDGQLRRHAAGPAS